jgi:flagellar biosynthesis/type III secretory pathway protein FliH
MSVVRIIFAVLVFLAWFIGGLLLFHKRGWRKGYAAGLAKGVQDGIAEGFDKGLKDGFEAGKVHADNFWIHAEQDVDQVRQKMRKEGWP